MKHYQNERGVMLVLDKGEELIESLNRFASEQQLASAWLSGGIGAANQATIAFYDPETREYVDRELSEPLEILSLQGNLAWVDGGPFWHIHGTLAGANYQAVGGHIKHLRVGLTCELLVTPLETKMTRTYDETTGLKLLTD